MNEGIIKKIEKLEFGIIEDNKVQTVDDFKRFNLIYGWNYSGKTTLSRLFASIENGILPEEYENPKFKVLLRNQTTIDSRYLENNSLNKKIKVFNKDFVENNIDVEARKGGKPLLCHMKNYILYLIWLEKY